jgi:hypothetical protein
MRTRLALAALALAGCPLIKTNVSTPDSRKQEFELAARKSAAVEQADRQRGAAETKEKAALADRAAAQKARDDGLIKAIETARADLAAGFTADKAAAFAARVGDAEGSAPARDGRLDMPALAREAGGHLERAAVDPPSYEKFTALTGLPAWPERDAAILRACPKVRPAVPKDAVLEFFAACLRAAGDDPRALQWPGVKADLAAHRKAEDDRQKADAEAAEAARTRAKTLAFAVIPLFAGGHCQASDCAGNGWTAPVEGGDLRARCSFSKCLTDGWLTELPDGTDARTRCRFSDCNKDGWDTELTGGLMMRTRCGFSDCAKNGWTLELPDGTRAETRCSGGDCFKNGWQTSFPDGRTVACRCAAGDCRTHGAECQ